MEAGGAGGRRPPVGRLEASPERGRPPPTYALSARPAPARPMRKVQIIYYLCRNGQLEHPHFMELAQHPHQPLRLKDVMDRLTLLRGKGMPALFSWSCKRNYKNGYVWNDLSENDVIYPSDGVEYVLKGSEIFPGCSSDRFQPHLRMTDRSPTKPALALPHMSHKQYADSYRDDAVEDRDDDELGYSYHHRRTASSGRLVVAARADKAAVSARTTNRARPVELPVEETSPPSSTSSDKPPAQQQQGRRASDPLPEPVEPSRPGSMLLQLIACGSTLPAAAGGGGGSGKCRAEPRRSCGLVSRLSARGGADDDEDDDEEDQAAVAVADVGRRFGHLAVENKEYFSGSIVEGAGGRGTPLPASSLKRSNSYNEERSCTRPGAGAIGEETTMDEQMEGDGGIRGRCIPGRKKPTPPQK